MTTNLADAARDIALRIRGGLVLTVESGTHAGARLKANGSELSVGSASANDAVLIADALAPTHFRVGLADVWRSMAIITAENDSIVVNERRTLLAGQYQRLPLPVHVRAGQATIRVGLERDWRALLSPPKAAATAGLVLTLAIGVSIVSPFKKASDHAPAIAAREALAPRASWSTDTLESAMAALRSELGKAGLGNDIRLESGPGGSLVASGSVDPSLSDKWRDVLKWYDARPGGPLLVNNVARGTRTDDLPAFRAVWVDANPQVVLASGQTAKPGDTVSGGWRIDGIDRQGIVVERGGRTLRVPFSTGGRQ